MSYDLRIEANGGLDLESPNQDEDVDKLSCIEFSAGNPRVECTYGLVHLYRDLVRQDALACSLLS